MMWLVRTASGEEYCYGTYLREIIEVAEEIGGTYERVW